MRKSLTRLLGGGALLTSLGCAQPRYALHTAYKLVECDQVVSRDSVTAALIKNGFVRNSQRQGPYDVFHKPEILEKGLLATEKFEDKAGDIAVAVCQASGEQYLLVEEWKSCPGRKDCTKENQAELRKLAEEWGCQVSGRAGHSESWKLENRQDWTRESCASIASKLTF